MFGIFRMNEDESSMVITLMVIKAPEYRIQSYCDIIDDSIMQCKLSKKGCLGYFG